ncbi:MAG: hypothetical protein K6G85_00195, partial [Eubacterium sp.]|nr:hypothetical protein [Eubacterium sp.]
MANDIYSRIAAHNKEVRKNKKQKKSNDSLYERINQHNTYVRETQQNNNLTGTNQTGGVPAFQNNGILQRAAREMTQRIYNAQPKPIERISTELHPAGTRQLQSESLAEKHFNQVVKNTKQAAKDTGFANTSSYAERKQIIDKLRVNPYKGNLEKQISQYESGKEYLEDAKKRNETVTPDNFVKWMERNNRNLEDEAQNIYMKQGDDWSTAYDKSKNAVNSLKSADEKEKGWKEDKEKSGLLQVIANNNLKTTKDYEDKMAEYQQRVDNAPVDKIGDIQREWLEKYDDKYLHQKHQELWDSLSEDERKEIMEQTELSTRLKYAGDASDKNYEYRPEYLEGADGTFYNRYAYDPEYLEKKQKELEKRYSKEDAENIMKFAQAYVNEEMLPIDLEIARENANDSDVVTVLLDSAIKNLVGGVSGMTGAIGQRMGRTFGDESTIDWNNQSMRQMQAGQEMRAEKGKNIDNGFLQAVYQAAGSTADMAVASPTLAVPLVGKSLFTAILSSEAGTSQMLDAHNRGLSDTEAVGEGLVTAMAEYGSERLSLEMLLPEVTKIGSLRNVLKHIGKGFVAEGSEEVVSGTLTELYDRMVADDKSQYSIEVKKLMSEGKSEKEAKKIADENFIKQLGEEFTVGGIAGAMFGSVTGTGAYVMNRANTQTITNNGQQIIDNGESENLINFAQNMREDSESFKKAQELGKKKKVSAEDIGELQQQVMAEISEEAGNNYGDVVNEAEVRLEQMGVEDVDTAKEAVANVLTSSQVTEEQIDMIENVPGVKEVLNSLTIDFPENTNASTAIATIRSMSEKVEKSAAEHIPDKPETVKADTKLPDAVKLSGTEIQSAVEDGSYHPTYSLQSSVTTPQGHGTIREIVHTGADNRQVIVDYDNGTSDLVTIDADNDYVDDEVEGALYSMANDMGYHGANALIRNANTNMFDSFDSIKAYSDNARTIYNAGVNNDSFESVYNGSSLALTMPETVAYRFYNAGVMDRQNNQSVTRAEWNEKKKKSTQRRTTDKTDYYDIKNYKEINTAAVAERMSEGQKEEVTAVKKIAEVTGIKVKFFESKNVDGKLKGANGFFNPKTNEIWIDINAGRTVAGLGRTTMVKTLSHELTHWIKNQGGSLYADYEKAVMDYLTNARGISREELIQEKMDSFGGKISREAAVDEIVADASEMMLKDTKVLNEVAEKNQSWFQQVKDHVMEVIEKIRNAIQKAYSNVKATSAEAKILTKLDGAMEDLQKMWDSALVEATENRFINENRTSIKLRNKNDYPYNMQTVIQEYINSVNEELVEAYKKVVGGNLEEHRNKIGKVSKHQIDAFQTIGNINVEGYDNCINTSALQHISQRHGIEGKQDNSMKDPRDVGRIPYILENYDDVSLVSLENGEPKTTNAFLHNGKPAKIMMFSKKINGTFYVVEAVAESSYKKVWVISAYIKKRVTQTPDANAPGIDVQNASASPLTSNISQKKEDNNGIFSMRSDSEGRELTPQQQEFFKNSKVVDEDGNLQVVYHGTNADFNIFDLKEARDTEDIEGFFFSNNYEES